MSAGIWDQIKRKLAVDLDDLGPKTLKNIAEAVHVYRVVHEPAAVGAHEGQPGLTMTAKPSVAVLPFTNLSGEVEQSAFTDGLTEDLITDLSRNAGSFVIARHSTFAYKGKSVDVRVIARDLGVRYILQCAPRRRPRAHQRSANRRRGRRSPLGRSCTPNMSSRFRSERLHITKMRYSGKYDSSHRSIPAPSRRMVGGALIFGLIFG